jgi:hypothetical protein
MSNKEETICAATTIRAPIHEIEAFVNYSLNVGIDHVFLFCDSPEDLNFIVPIVHPKVTCVLCDDKYWKKTGKKKEELSVEERQRFNANLIFKYAKNKYKWFIHLDGDELILPRKPLKEILSVQKSDIDFFRIPALEAVSEKEHYGNMFKEINLFKNNFGRISRKLFRAHICGKSIIRTSAKVDCVGIHRPESKHGLKSKIFLFDVRLLHFDCCGFINWKNKWERRMKKDGLAKDMGERRGRLLKQFKKVYSEGDEKALYDLYRAQFFISPIKKRILKSLWLLRKIDLDETLFEKSCEMK